MIGIRRRGGHHQPVIAALWGCRGSERDHAQKGHIIAWPMLLALALPFLLGDPEAAALAKHVERRLTTILAADVVGYSRLMQQDEDGTMRGLTACRAIIEALVAEHRGRIANTAGDAVLAEFPSVATGLVCAIAVQRAMLKQWEDFPPHRRIQFRIGLHVGDVMTRDGDLFGDAVNIAAGRGEIGEEGGSCVSEAV